MSDEYVFETSTATQENSFEFMKKDLMWAADNNQGSYQSGQITFDLQQFANNSKYINWQESFLAIPLVLNLHSNNLFSADDECVFAASLKNGVHQLIHSAQIKLTNNDVQSTVNYKNMHINYELLCTLNENDVKKLGSTILFNKDTHSSFRNKAKDGLGLSNNRLIPSANAPANRNDINFGRIDRMEYTCVQPDLGYDLEVGGGNLRTLFTETWKNNVRQNDGSNITYHILSIIPMRIFSDFFNKMPMAKNAYYQLVINTNTNVYSTLTYTIAGNAVTSVAQTTSSPNGVTPYIISPATHEAEDLSSGLRLANAVVDQSTVSVSLDISRSREPTATPHPLSQCRMYCSMVTMTPMYEELYLKNKLKRVLFNDFLSYSGGSLSGITPNTQINHILTSGISRLRKLIIYPFRSAVSNAGYSPIASPFTTEPATCSPYCFLSQFNVSLSSTPIYPQNQQYNFENYLHEVYPCGAINGGLSSGMNSGLIAQHEWDTSYGMVVVNLERHLPSEDDVSRSVSIQFTNRNTHTIDVICLLEYEKELSVDVELGALVI